MEENRKIQKQRGLFMEIQVKSADRNLLLELSGELEKHAHWVNELQQKHHFTAETVSDILKAEVGAVFAKVLEHAGVFKRSPEGQAAFRRFIDTVNQ